MDAPANGSPRELGPSVVGGAGASSRFERQDATHAEAGSVPRNQAGSQAAAPGDGFCPGLAKRGGGLGVRVPRSSLKGGWIGSP